MLTGSKWEEVFTSWAKPPSETEQNKAENAERAIKAAIDNHPKLALLDITVFAQGSYKANTNVRLNSDVDICVRYNDASFDDYPTGKESKDYGRSASDFKFATFKSLVGEALVERFGADSVNPGNKAFDVHANTYRLDADVVPAFERRRYPQDGSNNPIYGIAFLTGTGQLIENWPDQTYENGVQKNTDTNRRYKQVIRILKRLRNHMQEKNILAAKDVGSFLIESLVWNVPDPSFAHETFGEDLRAVLAHTFNATLNDQACQEWGEVNELKYLFRGSPGVREKAHAFLSAAWDYVGLE